MSFAELTTSQKKIAFITILFDYNYKDILLTYLSSFGMNMLMVTCRRLCCYLCSSKFIQNRSEDSVAVSEIRLATKLGLVLYADYEYDDYRCYSNFIVNLNDWKLLTDSKPNFSISTNSRYDSTFSVCYCETESCDTIYDVYIVNVISDFKSDSKKSHNVMVADLLIIHSFGDFIENRALFDGIIFSEYHLKQCLFYSGGSLSESMYHYRKNFERDLLYTVIPDANGNKK